MRREIDGLIRDDYQPEKKEKEKDKTNKTLDYNKQIDTNNIYQQNDDDG
jgi:hypothetical protein